MIARPQAELMNMLPVTQVTPLAAKALDGGLNARFDAALLEAAKTMRDSAPQAPELTLVPRVQQAFENALSELSQKPIDQLKTLAAQPKAARPEVAAIVARAAQAAGLSAEESAVLQDLVPLALPRVLAHKAEIQIPGTPVLIAEQDGEKPGPQGGYPAKAASPADLDLKPLNGPQPIRPEPPAPDAADSTKSPLVALAQALPTPILVSTRTDDGSGRSSALNPSAGAQPTAAPTAPGVQPQGRVIQVSSTQRPQAVPQPGSDAALMPPPTAPRPVANPSAAAPAPATQPLSAQAIQGTAAPAPTAPGSSPTIAAPKTAIPPQGGDRIEGARPQAPQGNGQPATAASGPALPALDFQVQAPGQPLAIVPGSELTLKEDGTWVQPSPVSKPAPALPQGNAPVAAQTPVPQDPAAPLQPVPTQAAAPASQAPSSAPSLEPQAPAPAQAPQSGSPNVPAAQTSDGRIPAAQAATVQALQPQAPKAQGPTTESAVRGLEAADRTEGFQAPAQADALQARRNAGDSGFGGLAQFGQDPVKAIAQQAARDYAVRESVFRQVSQALREAPGTDNGRMLIRLKPAELGEVHVDLSLVNGKLSARLVAGQVEVRDAFVRDLHAFKAGLESQGVSVRDISVAVRAGVADQQPQQPQQQAPQAWWRELPREERTPLLAVAPVAFGAAGGATDQRFSALA